MNKEKTSLENLYIMVLKDFYLITEWMVLGEQKKADEKSKEANTTVNKSLEELYAFSKKIVDDYIKKASQKYYPNLYISLNNYLNQVDNFLYGIKTIKNFPLKQSDEYDIYFSYGFLSGIMIIAKGLDIKNLSKFGYKGYIHFSQFIDAFGHANNLIDNYEKNFAEELNKTIKDLEKINIKFIEKWINKIELKKLSPMNKKKRNKRKKTHKNNSNNPEANTEEAKVEDIKEENTIIVKKDMDNDINMINEKSEESNLDRKKDLSQKPKIDENLNNINKAITLSTGNISNSEMPNIQNKTEESIKNSIINPTKNIEVTEFDSINKIESSDNKKINGENNKIENANIPPNNMNETKDDITLSIDNQSPKIEKSNETNEKSQSSLLGKINDKEMKNEINDGTKTLTNRESNDNINPIEQLRKEMEEFKEKSEKDKQENKKKIQELTKRIEKLETNQILLYNQICLFQTSRDIYKSIYFHFYDYLNIKFMAPTNFDKLKIIIRYLEEKDVTKIQKWKSDTTPDISDDLKQKLSKYFKLHFFINTVTNKLIHRNFDEEQKKLLKSNNNNGLLSLIPGFDFDNCFDTIGYFIENSVKDEQVQTAMKFVYDSKYINDIGLELLKDTNKEVIKKDQNGISFLITKKDIEEVRNYFKNIKINNEPFTKICNDTLWDKDDSKKDKDDSKKEKDDSKKDKDNSEKDGKDNSKKDGKDDTDL